MGGGAVVASWSRDGYHRALATIRHVLSVAATRSFERASRDEPVSTLVAELAERIDAIAADIEEGSANGDVAAQVSGAKSNVESAKELIERGGVATHQ
jgi:methyl-accepting chemotaxis protein